MSKLGWCPKCDRAMEQLLTSFYCAQCDGVPSYEDEERTAIIAADVSFKCTCALDQTGEWKLCDMCLSFMGVT